MGSAHRGAEKPRKMKTFIVMMILSLGVIHCQRRRPGRRPTGQCEEGQTCQVLKNCQELADIYPDKKRKLEIQQIFNSRVCNRKERKVCCTAPQIDSTTAEHVSELSLESIFGQGHAGVIQRTAFRPSLNQTEISVPAHGAFLALDVVIQGLGGEDQVTDPYLLTVKEEKCFMNNLPNDLDPAKASSGNTGRIAKKHLIQTNIRRIYEATADYEELPGKVRNKCEGKEIFKGGYKFLSQEQYEESMETENFIGHSPIYHSSTNQNRYHYTNLMRTKRYTPVYIPQCMREYKCTYDGGRGCFCFGSFHVYNGQREKCVCCKRNCPQSTIGNDCKCGDLRAGTFLNCYNSQNWYGPTYPTEDTCTSPTNGGWGSWTSWSECSSGSNPTSWSSWTSWSSCCTKRRSRNCDNPAPSNGGVYCSGDQDQTVEDCRPVDGGWGSWASWSSCFIGPNGYQIRKRSRPCDNPQPINGGSNCPGNYEETENCAAPKKQPCFVSRGPAAGEPCVFPFKHNGRTYTACTDWVYANPPQPEGTKWCSTKVDDDGVHVNGFGHYGFCPSTSACTST